MKHSHILLDIILLWTCCITANAHEIFKECANAVPGTFIAREELANSCQAYIYCGGSDSYADDCPRGTYFEAAQQQCSLIWGDFECPPKVETHNSTPAEGVGGSMAITEPTTKAAYTPYTEESEAKQQEKEVEFEQRPTMLTRPICRRGQDGYFPHPLRCEYFYRCSSGYLSILRCNFQDSWDYVQEQCVPKRTVNCYTTRA